MAPLDKPMDVYWHLRQAKRQDGVDYMEMVSLSPGVLLSDSPSQGEVSAG